MIGIERKFQLIAAGYTVEDMCNVWGPQFDGQYRWINRSIEDRCDGFGEIQYSEADAWPTQISFRLVMASEKIKVPVPKPFIRTPIPPTRREKDRKNDYSRQPKHKKPPLDG